MPNTLSKVISGINRFKISVKSNFSLNIYWPKLKIALTYQLYSFTYLYRKFRKVGSGYNFFQGLDPDPFSVVFGFHQEKWPCAAPSRPSLALIKTIDVWFRHHWHSCHISVDKSFLFNSKLLYGHRSIDPFCVVKLMYKGRPQKRVPPQEGRATKEKKTFFDPLKTKKNSSDGY